MQIEFIKYEIAGIHDSLEVKYGIKKKKKKLYMQDLKIT